MATLNWIGKEKVINHHLDVPFRTLKHKYTYKDGQTLTDGTRSENKIIHGDNLEALKSLLPEYEGKIKCIYIDPPYNTGEESWVYNDNVNHPKIIKWLGEVVGKEGEDLTRHDKWLCMMYPRLKILHKLLSKDGVIFVSIDDNEIHHLRLILNEIFGEQQFISNFIWEKRTNRENRKIVSSRHDNILCYCKHNNNFVRAINLLPMSGEALSRYKNIDHDPRGPWKSDPATAQAGHATKSQFYTLVAPNGKQHEPQSGRCWLYTKEVMDKAIAENKIWFGKDGNGVPRIKTYLNDKERGLTPESIWFAKEVSTNESAKNELKKIFGGSSSFNTPKPYELIIRILQISTNTGSNDIVLDSFSGSGSTAHAVLQLNKQDNGNRKFILIEMEDYAESVTAERVKRVINGYGKDAQMIQLTDGEFEFLELGDPLFNKDDYINEEQSMEDIRKYVYYSETRTNSGYSDNPRNEYYLGKKAGTAYYFYYKKDSVTTLDLEFASKITIKSDQYIVYADKCSLSEKYLAEHNIIFKKIPRDITRI